MLVLPPLLEGEHSPAVLAAAGVAAAGLLYYLVTTRARPREKLREIHRPRDTLPVLGNALSYYTHRHDIRAWVVSQCLEFGGEPWIRKIPGQPEIITIALPELIEEITTTQFANFEKGPFQIDILASLFGRGIVSSDGERWFHQRKAAAKFFSARSLRALMNRSMHKNLEQVCAVLDEGEQRGEKVDLKKLFHEFTLQTFVEMGLGVELDWIGTKHPHPFQEATDRASPLVITRFRSPAWMWKLQRWLNVGVEAELTKQMAIVYSWLHDIIGKSLRGNKKPHAGDGRDTKSVIELFLAYGEEDKDGLRPEDLADFVLTFVVAARDTTATTLAWLFYALGKHPEVEQKVREELQRNLPELAGRKDVLITPDQVKDLPYLEATIRETLRLYPAAPATVKQVVRDTIIGGDIPMRKGQVCILHAYAMARNPAVWGDDAAEFKPERWIDSDNNGQIRQIPPSKFFTFHAGPRTCIGMSLAFLELRSVTANLLNRYKFGIDPSNDGSVTLGPTLIMKMPLYASVSSVNK